MKHSRRMLLPVFVMTVVGLPTSLCLGQQPADSGQATPAVTGTGNANHIAIWKNSTTLGSSGIVATGGNVGIGTGAPAAKLEVNGDAQVDGNFSLSGSIVETGVGQLLWAPNGSENLSVGLGALPSTTTGNGNTATGDAALMFNTAGSGNTASGQTALMHNSTGNVNTAVGINAMQFCTTGSNNTVIGGGALNCLRSSGIGSGNIAIGILAGGFAGDGSNNIHIGNQGATNDSGTIRIGTPFVGGCTTCQTSAYVAGIYGSSTGLANVGVVVDANGNLGTVQSSRRYKEDIHDMGDASDGLMRLRPVTFRYKKAFDDGSKPIQYGLIAEEVAEVYPDLVARSADGQIETVKYQLLDSMLLNELQKQNSTITAQKEQIRSLEERLARVEAALSGTTVTTSSR